MTVGPISIRQVVPAKSRETVIRLLDSNLPEAASDGRFDWAYIDNPHGEALVWLAETAEGEPIGTSAAFPRKFSIRGSTVEALVLSDFAIEAGFRSLGPAITLLRETLGAVDDGRYAFCLDYPSATMAAVYRRLGGVELGHQSRYVRLLSVRAAAQRRWGRGVRSSVVGLIGDTALKIASGRRRSRGELVSGVQEATFDDEFADVSADVMKTSPVFGERDTDYLNWRFQGGIRFDFRAVTVRYAGKLLAYAVIQIDTSKVFQLVEFFCPRNAEIEQELLAAVVEFGKNSGAETLQASAVCGSPWIDVLRRSGFREREQANGPIVYTAKNSELENLLKDNREWWITDGDRDG